jgi:hypothetical protein
VRERAAQNIHPAEGRAGAGLLRAAKLIEKKYQKLKIFCVGQTIMNFDSLISLV